MSSALDDISVRARHALRHWGLADQRPELLKYRENAVFRVRLADGGSAALRLHRPGYHSEAALVSELEWMADLRQNGIAVPEPIRTANGSFLVSLDEGAGQRQYADLIGWVEGAPLGETGRPLGRSRAELQALFGAIGREMARLHVAADRYAPPSYFERPSWDMPGLLGDNPFWGRFWDCAGLDPADRDFLSDLRDRLLGPAGRLATGLDRGLIHADLVRENVLVDGARLTFIDFDDCGFGFRLFDIATALLRNRREPDYETIRQSLLEGYASVRPAMQAEFRHLPLFLLLRSLTYIGWAGARPDLPDNADRLARYVQDARALAADHHDAA